MIRGVKIELGGREFTVPALTLDQLEAFEEDIAAVSRSALSDAETFAKDRLAAMARVIHAAISRNYEELCLDDVKKLLDLGNIGHAWMAVMGVSGLIEKKEPRVGEAKAEGPAPTGTASAPASAPTPDGTGTKPES